MQKASVAILWFGLLLAPAAAAPPLDFPDETHRLLVARLRARMVETAEMESRFNGGVTSTAGPFTVLGKVDFILAQANHFPRRYLHHQDHNFVYSAVAGQSAAELEANLAAIVHYVRLAMAARWYNYRARQRLPLVGERAGLPRVTTIAKRVFDFRARQLERIESGAVRPSQVLTPANLGELGRPELLADVRQAYRAGQDQFTWQRNSVVFVLLGFELGISFLLAVLYLRRARPLVVVQSLDS